MNAKLKSDVHLLLEQVATPLLRKLFERRWENTFQVNLDDPECVSILESHLGRSVLNKDQKRLVFTPEQVAVDMWDISLLCTILLNLRAWKTDFEEENGLIESIRTIRNFVAHTPYSRVTDAEFRTNLSTLKETLVALGVSRSYMDGHLVKGGYLSERELTKSEMAILEKASTFRKNGNQLFSSGKYQDALECYSAALLLVGLPDDERSVLHSNRALCYLKDTGIPDRLTLALRDANTSVFLQSSWWKGYLRLAQVYDAQNRFEEALEAIDNGLALEPVNAELKSIQENIRKKAFDHLTKFDSAHMSHKTLKQSLQQMKENDYQDLNVEELAKALKGMPIFDDLIQAHDHLAHGNFEMAAKMFSKAAAAGNADAQYNLGVMLCNGRGIPQDVPKGIALLELAASAPPELNGIKNSGVVDAMHGLGLHYEMKGFEGSEECLKWYQKAAKLGHPGSVNNMGLMYMHGKFVPKDHGKAEEYLTTAARYGDSNAMFNLADFYLKTDPKEAMKWNERAIEKGCLAALERREKFKEQCSDLEKLSQSDSGKFLSILDELTKSSALQVFGSDELIYRPDVLREYALRGGRYAQTLFEASTLFWEVIAIFEKYDLDKMGVEIENQIVDNIYNAILRTEIVCTWTAEWLNKFNKIVERVFSRGKMEAEARACMIFRNRSHPETIKMMNVACRKFPNRWIFFRFRASAHAFLQDFEKALTDINKAIELCPEPVWRNSLFFDRASTFNLLHSADGASAKVEKTVRDAFLEYIDISPPDDRHIPKCYYVLAMRAYVSKRSQKSEVQKWFKKGLEAERDQISYFLPYKCSAKKFVEQMTLLESVNISAPSSTVRSSSYTLKPGIRPTLFTDNMIAKFREKSAAFQKMTNHSIQLTCDPPVKSYECVETDYEMVTFKDLDMTKDMVHHGKMIQLTIFDRMEVLTPSLHLLVFDSNYDVQSMSVYHLTKATASEFKRGLKLNLRSPRTRAFKNGDFGLRVDDRRTLSLDGGVEAICSCCGISKSSMMKCSQCKTAMYCGKQCQIRDWKELNHKLVCSKSNP